MYFAKEYSYSLVHMGGLRPFLEEHFESDALEGYGVFKAVIHMQLKEERSN